MTYVSHKPFRKSLRVLRWRSLSVLLLSFAAVANAQPAQDVKPGAQPGRLVPNIPRNLGKAPAQAGNAPAQAAAAAAPDSGPEPPGFAGSAPTTTDKIAQATDVPYRPKPGGQPVKFNIQEADLAELVNWISGLTGRRFIYGSKVRQVKATVVAPEPVSLEEAYQAFLSILDANGLTVVPHGRFLKIIDSNGVATQPTPIYARGEPVPESDRMVTRLYRLSNVSADEAMQLLAKFKSKDGDISLYAPGRLLIITDTATQIRRLVRLIEEIDVGGVGQHLWIEPVRFASATDVAKRLNELFELGAPPPAPGQPVSPMRSAGLTKVLAEELTNSLIVIGTQDSYLRLLEILKRVDVKPSDNEKQVHVLALQHAIAEELAGTLTQMLGATQQPRQQGHSGPGQPGATFEGEIKIVADKRTNSLVVTSSDRDYASLRIVMQKLDRPRRQVFIEAVIMDLSVSDINNLGLAFHGGSALGANNDTLLLGGFQAGKSVGFPADPNLLQGLAAGVRGPNLPGTQGLLGNTGLSIPAFGVVLNALATSGRTNVLATPHIIATDNTAAEISIGENIPLQQNLGGMPSGGVPGQAGGVPGFGFGFGGFSSPRQDVGNKIKVTPHINESNQVRLEIEQESSAPGAAVGALGVVPITKRTANTTVVVADQQTVVIGGLMKEDYINTREKIPVLGDLPLLGALFRRNDITKRKTNLLLVLTPHVVRDQSDLRRIFERKFQERQEFLDRYFVFATDSWKPPRDWSRTNGLLEDIRKSFSEIAEDTRLEEESRSLDEVEHAPGEPIELPERPNVTTTSQISPDGELRSGPAIQTQAPVPGAMMRNNAMRNLQPGVQLNPAAQAPSNAQMPGNAPMPGNVQAPATAPVQTAPPANAPPPVIVPVPVMPNVPLPAPPPPQAPQNTPPPNVLPNPNYLPPPTPAAPRSTFGNLDLIRIKPMLRNVNVVN